jgi:hypothetical protein
MQLRYLGFDQLQNARAFRFDIITKGEVTKHAVVTADLALFLQHHVGIQDGPTLCASKLSADLEHSIDGVHVLTADDIRAHAAARATAEAKRIESRRGAHRRPVASPGAIGPDDQTSGGGQF